MASRMASALLEWYEQHGRHDLPWQNPQTPYRVWVSEIMLQQTQVATVIGYFERFMQRFPDVQSLAAADSDDVMSHWAGLGYYARARNLHAAAKTIVKAHGGELPETREELEALPGIGRSTAGAILSLASGKCAPILDGNCKRVYARYFGEPGWPGETRIARRLWAYAEQHTPNVRAGDFAQAIMDLGATLCTRKSPACARCPLRQDCRALAENAVECYPYPRPKKKRPLRHTRILAITEAGKVLLQKRPPAGIWGGLWTLPEVPEASGVATYAREQLGTEVDQTQEGQPFRHGFTHFELELQPIVAKLSGAAPRVSDDESLRWYSLDQLPGVPAPIAKFLTHLEQSGQT